MSPDGTTDFGNDDIRYPFATRRRALWISAVTCGITCTGLSQIVSAALSR
jgi:hypothetical protein